MKKQTLEAIVCLILARCALRLTPFRHIATWLKQPGGLPDPSKPIQVQRHIQTAAQYLPWDPKCFEKSLAAKIMLRRRNIATKFYLGVKKEGDRFVAHAWLEHEEASNYVKLVSF